MSRRTSHRPSVAVPISPPASPAPVDYSDPVAVMRTWVTAPAWKPLVNSRPSDWVAVAVLGLVSTAVVFAVCAAGGLLYALVDILHSSAGN